MPEELWTEVCNTVQEVITKAIPNKKKCKKVKWLSEEVLHIAEGKKKSEKQGRKGKIYLTNTEFQRRAKRDKKTFVTLNSF